MTIILIADLSYKCNKIVFKITDSTSPENNIQDNTAEYWKQKYIALLEEYNQLLKNK